MWNAIPFIGWMISVGVAISMAIPFWLFWTVNHIGAKYFYFMPTVYQAPGFWDTVMLFVVASIIKSIFIPSLASSVNINKD
jgi:hypothetical protein